MGLTISEEEFASMKIGEIRKRMAAYKKENKKKKTEAIVETAPVEKELESQPVESEVLRKRRKSLSKKTMIIHQLSQKQMKITMTI